jgi:iron complex outermembrane receptor protein
MGGDSRLTLAANYNKTEVDSVGTVNPIDEGRVAAIEDLLPNLRGNLSWFHSHGDISTLVRANYYGGWDDTGNGVNGIGAEVLLDVQVSYQLNDETRLVAGIDNLLDAYPEENPGAGGSGQLYSEASPFGFNGATWYVQARYTF